MVGLAGGGLWKLAMAACGIVEGGVLPVVCNFLKLCRAWGVPGMVAVGRVGSCQIRRFVLIQMPLFAIYGPGKHARLGFKPIGY